MGKVIMSGRVPRLKIPGTLTASELAVGSSIYLMDNGEVTEYIVVHQGRPDESNYMENAIGTWVLRKDLPYTSTKSNAINLSNVYEARFDDLTLECMKDSTLKYYYTTTDASGTVVQASSSCTQKIHSPGAIEIGKSSLGSKQSVLSYFSDVEDESRIAYNIDGEASQYYTRDTFVSPVTKPTGEVTYTSVDYKVSPSGSINSGYFASNYVRPMMILDYNTVFDKKTLLLKGVS